MQYSNSIIDRASLRHLAKSEYPEITRRQPHRLRLALNEAEALAFETGFPDLFALDLADEKLATLNRWHMRQQSIMANLSTAPIKFGSGSTSEYDGSVTVTGQKR